VVRMVAIDQAIRAGKWPNARTLAETLEVRPRTIRRDIAFMRDQLQAPIEFDAVRNGYFYSQPATNLPFLHLTEGELTALLLSERLIRQFRGTPFEQDIRRAFEKLTTLLPEAVSVRLDTLSDCLSVTPTATIDYDPAMFSALAGATVRQRCLKIAYWSASQSRLTHRAFDPYHLMLVEEGWYVIGRCHLREEVRVFAVQRVRSATETGESFERPTDFDFDEYMSGSFRLIRGDAQHRVVLRFQPTLAARIAERTWHPSQTREPTPDGGLILSFEVNDLREVSRWVLHWGSDCQVLEPTELRDAITKELKRMLDSYKASRRSSREQ
jgi:predicted DNA-binding transcriptional regulator YafY